MIEHGMSDPEMKARECRVAPEIPFHFEERLQELLALMPEALSSPRWPGPRLLLGREIAVSPMALAEDQREERSSMLLGERMERTRDGRIDLCFAECDGTPTIVETKLCSNPSMATVVDQALGYARDAFAHPAKVADRMRRTFGILATRWPGTRNAGPLLRKALPGMDLDQLHARLRARLEERRCRVVIVADALPSDVVATTARQTQVEAGIELDLIVMRRRSDGSASALRLASANRGALEQLGPLPSSEPTWEPVSRKPIVAEAYLHDRIKDRFYRQRDEHRLSRIGELPRVLHYEIAPGRVRAGDPHQIERSRPEGCAPVMPNLGLLRSTGNPYPRDGSHRSIVTDERYRAIVAICHAAWARLARDGFLELHQDETKALQREFAATASFLLDKVSAEVRAVALMAPFDAMRDCALFGLVRHLRRRHDEHRFELLGGVPDALPIGQ